MRLLLAVTLAVLAASTTAAQAQGPACGDVLTHSVRLSADLACAPGDTALTIGADDIVLDLGGHAITGAELAVDARGGFDGIIVRGGELRDNSLGIRLAGVRNGRLAHLTISGGLEGVSATGGRNLSIRDVDSCAVFNPILLSDERGDRVRRSRVCGSETGMTVTGGREITIAESSFEDNVRVGLRISGTRDSVVKYSRASGNRRVGFSIGGGSTGNRLVENEATHNASGIEVEAGATGNRLRGNVASLNDAPPVFAFFPTDGIDVFEPTTVLRDNVAKRNPGFGIYAPNGAVDAGGNRARDNGLGDCVNVAC
jgi:parallel beta-helix repeat protein